MGRLATFCTGSPCNTPLLVQSLNYSITRLPDYSITGLDYPIDNMSRHDVSCRDMGTTPPRKPADSLPLTPALFHVLLSLADGEKHGYAVLKEVEQRTGGDVRLSTGTLYGIIKRLLAEGMIRESAAGSDDRRRAYKLTAFGRNVALAEAERLRDLVAAAHAKKLLANPGV
jgi:DNA-binding PadR family transcriptional regulator